MMSQVTDYALAHGAMGMNVVQDSDKVPTSMPKEGEVEEDQEDGGGEEEVKKESTGKDALGDKARLKAWLSS